MKLTFILSSLYFVSVNAGLRSPSDFNLAVDEEVAYEDANNQHELDTHHRQQVLHNTLVHDLPSSRSLGIDPLLPGISISTRNNCSSNQRGVRIGESKIAFRYSIFTSFHLFFSHSFIPLNIVIKTDDEGHETSWSFRKLSDSEADYLGPDDGGNYESSTTYSGTICAPIGMYQFIIKGVFIDYRVSLKSCLLNASLTPCLPFLLIDTSRFIS